jgi:uncharacterized protein YacL
MSIRSFKQLFSIVFALIFCILASVLGFQLRTWVASIPANTPSQFLGALKDQPAEHLTFTAGALGIIGLLLGVITGPKVADRLINAGNDLEAGLKGMSTKDKIAVTFGILLGIFLTMPFVLLLTTTKISVIVGVSVSVLIGVAFIYLSIRATTSMKDEFRFLSAPPPVPEPEVNPSANCKILDTNVIIDGRIADVCRTGFVEGPLYVPGFVLEELQHIADSGDNLKRARGRRGLDILNNMQKELPLIVRSWDKALEKSAQGDEVDTKLVKLAKALDGAIITNDFNLNKVAALQGVQVLNVNELANALKPVVLPGEVMMVGIVKEGKEPNQGVAYLDDGTMIVVEDGRRFIGDTLGVIVTSVLQTVAGKMIFARLRTDEEDGFDFNGRDTHGGRGDGNNNGSYGAGRDNYPRRGPGKKVR